MRKIKVIGLTGPSGSGKSFLSEILRARGICCINSDKVAREVTAPGSECLNALCKQFGDILNDDKTLNRKALAKIAFSSRANTDVLNSITHPFIMESVIKKITDFENKGEDIVVLEAPQLFESGADKLCDFIVCVISEKDLRIKRISERDNIDSQQAIARINLAHTDDFFKENSNMVIYNNGNKDELAASAAQLLFKISELSK